MAEPRVLDRKGRELSRGSAVLLRRLDRECRMTVIGINPPVEGLVSVILSAALPAWAEERNDGSFTCRELLLHHDKDKEAAHSCPDKGAASES